MAETIRTDPTREADGEGEHRTPNDPATGESPRERVDRELVELLNEPRVVLPGIQVLFAFLLTVPFSQRFTQMNGAGEGGVPHRGGAHGASTAALVAVPTHHRLTFREAAKERLIRTSNVLTLIGTAPLGVAMVAALFLITDLIYDGPWVGLFTAAAALVIAWLWFLVPITAKARRGLRDAEQGEEGAGRPA